MSKTYLSRRQEQSSPREQQGQQSRADGPSLQELAAGAMPSQEQMGHQVDLPDAIRTKMETSFGEDFSDVQLYESQTVADADARAITMGNKISFAPGQLDLNSSGGQAILGHELSHVASQARGEVSGRGFLADHALEARADREGARAAAGENVHSGPVTPISTTSTALSAAGPMQASKDDKKKGKKGKAPEVSGPYDVKVEHVGSALKTAYDQQLASAGGDQEAISQLNENFGKAVVEARGAIGQNYHAAIERNNNLPEDRRSSDIDIANRHGRDLGALVDTVSSINKGQVGSYNLNDDKELRDLAVTIAGDAGNAAMKNALKQNPNASFNALQTAVFRGETTEGSQKGMSRLLVHRLGGIEAFEKINSDNPEEGVSQMLGMLEEDRESKDILSDYRDRLFDGISEEHATKRQRSNAVMQNAVNRVFTPDLFMAGGLAGEEDAAAMAKKNKAKTIMRWNAMNPDGTLKTKEAEPLMNALVDYSSTASGPAPSANTNKSDTPAKEETVGEMIRRIRAGLRPVNIARRQ